MRGPLRVLALLGVAVIFTAAFYASAPAAAAGATRHYYVQAEDVVWDFAPTGQDQIHGGAIPAPWTNYHVWNKTRYIEYTDETFTVPKPQPAWLGVLGPIIRAEVGDTILVHFRNHASGSYGMHPHGVRYEKDSEGAMYRFAGAGAEIPPGGSFTYTWFADARSGPGPNDPSALVWWYHSHVDEPAETNAGLLGPIVITAKGRARADATPVDVDREFVTLYMIFNEDRGRERGLMHTINGYIFGNVPGLEARLGERVRWYVLGMGNEVDLHSAHWHASTVTYQGRHTDVIELLPGSMATADMVPDSPGTWLIHCHVADHIEAGMMALYTVR